MREYTIIFQVYLESSTIDEYLPNYISYYMLLFFLMFIGLFNTLKKFMKVNYSIYFNYTNKIDIQYHSSQLCLKN